MRALRVSSASWLAVAVFTTAAFAQAPASPGNGARESSFVLGASDVIRVWVWKEPDLTVSVVVRPDGKASLPLLGELDIAGRTPVEVQEQIKQRLSAFVEAPVVVIVEEINSSQFSVLGEVAAPNRFPLQQELTVLDAIAMAGGFTEFADRDEVSVLRRESDATRRIVVDLKRILAATEAPLILRPGDIVYVK